MLKTQEYWAEIGRVSETIPEINKLYGKSVLVTGATGLICSSVCDVLFYLNNEKKADIKIILAGRSKDRHEHKFPEATEGKDYTFLKFDSASLEPVAENFDYAIYGASYGDPKAIIEDPVGIIKSNIFGLEAILNKAATNCAKVLFISSSEIYGKRTSSEAYKEGDYGFIDILNPRACYPNAKRLGETLCASYSMQKNVHTVIARPGHIYGPQITDSDSRASAQFSRNAAAGQPIVLKSAGLQMRSYVLSIDCASAMLTMLLIGENAIAYNISNPKSVVSIRELAETFSKIGGVDLISAEPTKEEIKSYNLMDNSDLNADLLLSLGWKPLYDIKEGVAFTLRYLE